MTKSKRKGFSIIEVVLVLGIVGILTSFVVPQARNYLAMAKDAKLITTLNALRTAKEMYTAEKGENFLTTGSVLTFENVEVLKDYIKIDGVLKGTPAEEVTLDIGGSRTASDAEVIYGGQVKLEIDEFQNIILIETEGTGGFNTKGEEWSNL